MLFHNKPIFLCIQGTSHLLFCLNLQLTKSEIPPKAMDLRPIVLGFRDWKQLQTKKSASLSKPVLRSLKEFYPYKLFRYGACLSHFSCCPVYIGSWQPSWCRSPSQKDCSLSLPILQLLSYLFYSSPNIPSETVNLRPSVATFPHLHNRNLRSDLISG